MEFFLFALRVCGDVEIRLFACLRARGPGKEEGEAVRAAGMCFPGRPVLNRMLAFPIPVAFSKLISSLRLCSLVSRMGAVYPNVAA